MQLQVRQMTVREGTVPRGRACVKGPRAVSFRFAPNLPIESTRISCSFVLTHSEAHAKAHACADSTQ